MPFQLKFLGGANTVTGSKYLLTYKQKKILIDCGLFQGLKSLRLQNWDNFPIPPQQIHAIILTHAHIDHSGYIPRLIKNGFTGKIYCTSATKDLCRILLADSGRLMEEEADFLNRHHKTKHHPALPLFTESEANQSMDFFEAIDFEKEVMINQELGFHFRYVGHILGAASVLIKVDKTKILFTGDIGRQRDPLFYPPQSLPEIDYLITESTYGNRTHPVINAEKELYEAIKNVWKNKSVVMIPAFAVGRAQSLCAALAKLKRQGLLPSLPMYLNSPMAADVSALYSKYKDLHRLDEAQCKEMNQQVEFVQSVEESKLLNSRKGPMLLIAGSGMLTGGRILHHIKAFASNPNNLILLTGYQAPGTRGQALADHASEIKIHGEYIQIRAAVKILNSFSAHADFHEIIEWFSQSTIKPRKVFVTHGEPAAADELRRRLEEKFGWSCVVPNKNDSYELE